MCPPNVLCMILIHKVYQQSSNCMFCCIGRMGNGSTNQSAHDCDAPCKDKRTHTRNEERQRYSWVGTPGTTVRAWFRARPSCRGCGPITGLFSTFEICVLHFVCGGRVGNGSTSIFCMTLMHHVPQNDWIFCVSVCRSNGSCVLQTFFAWFWYTMYNNSLRIACFVVWVERVMCPPNVLCMILIHIV